MLDIAFELIGEATSNSLLMFCFCNLIIVMIFTGSSKPGSMGSQDSTFVNPVSYDMCYIASDDHHDRVDDHNDEAMTIAAAVLSAQDEPLIDDSSSDEEEDREISHCYADDDDDSDDQDDDDSDEDEGEDNSYDDEDEDENKEVEVEEDEGEDDLRTRVEEFIAKINNEWRHEKKLRGALNLVY